MGRFGTECHRSCDCDLGSSCEPQTGEINMNSRNLLHQITQPLFSRPVHLQERLLRPAVRPALPEGVLRRGLQAGELHQCTLATYCVKSRNLVPGVPAVHLGLRHLRLPDWAGVIIN